MRWWFSFGWLCRAWQNRRKRRPARRGVKHFRPQLEVLEERRLFANNVWLPQQLAAFDGTSQANAAMQLFQPATTTLLPQLGLQGTSVSANGSVSLTDNGNYQLDLTQNGPYDDNGDRYTLTESGAVSFSLVELGNFSATGFSITSITLTQTASLSWSFVETNSSGLTVQNLSGLDTVTPTSNGSAPFDPFFAQGFNWLPLTQQISSLNTLGLSDLAADSLSVTETDGSDNYVFQETNGVATVQGSSQQPLGNSLLQSGQDSYGETAVEQFDSTVTGSDCFSLSELGSYANNSYALSNVSYQETNGTQTSQFNATVVNSQSGSGTESGSQSFSGSNQSLGYSSGDSFQFNDVSTLSYGESATSAFTLSQQGGYGGGSFSLDSLVYNANGSGGYSLTQTSLQTQTGSFSDSNNASGADSYGVDGTQTDSGTSSDSGNFTTTSGGTLQDNESGNFTLSEAGAYGNGSWALSSYNYSDSLSGTFSQQQLATTTQSGHSTVTDSGTGSDSFLLNFGSSNTTSGGSTLNSTDTSTDSFTETSTDSSTQSGASSTTLSELGVYQNGSVNLTSFVYTSGQNGTFTGSGGSNEIDSGSAQDTASGSDNSVQTSSNGSVVASVLGSDNYSASDSYSFTSTDSSTTSDSGGFNQSVYQAGVFNNGSYALGSVVNMSSDNDYWSETDSDSSTDSGSDTSSDSGSGHNNSTAQLGGVGTVLGLNTGSYGDSTSGTFSDSSFDTTTSTGTSQFAETELGSYGNYSFSFTTVTDQDNGTSNATTQEFDQGSFTGTGTDYDSGTGTQNSTACYADSSASGTGTSYDSSSDSFHDSGVDTLTETVTSNDSWNDFMLGGFQSGLWNLSSVSYGESFSDSYSSQENDSSTDSGTDTFLSSATSTNNGTNVYGGDSITGSGTVTSSDNGDDSFTNHNNDTVTANGLDSYLFSEQGTFAGESFAFSSWVNQGGDSVTETTAETDWGTFTGVETDSTVEKGQGNSIGTYAADDDSGVASFSSSSSDSFSTSGSDSFSQTVVSSQSDSFYEAGVWSGDSLSLSLASYGSGGIDSWSFQGSDTSTDNGTVSEYDSAGGSAQLQVSATAPQKDSSNTSITGGDTLTGTVSDTATDSYNGGGSDSWGLTELGSYSNGSYSYSSYVESSGGNDSETSSDTANDSFSGTQSDSSRGSSGGSDDGNSGGGTLGLSGSGNDSGSDSFSENDNSQFSETVTSAETWNSYEAGSFSGNSLSLSSVAYSDSGGDTWSDRGNDTYVDSGVATVTAADNLGDSDGLSSYGLVCVSVGDDDSSNGTVNSTETITTTDSYSDSGGDTWSTSEQGIYGNYSYSLGSVVDQGGGSVNGTYQESSTDSFQDTSTQSSTDSSQDCIGDSEDDGSDMATASNSAVLSQTLSGNNGDSLTETDNSSWSDYEAGSFSGGSYAFASVNYQESGNDSVTEIDSNSEGGTFGLSGTVSEYSWDTQYQFYGGPYNGPSDGSADQFISGGDDSGSGSETQTSVETTQESESYTLSEQGSYANDSYNLSSYVYSSNDSGTVNAQQTDSIVETVTSTGSVYLTYEDQSQGVTVTVAPFNSALSASDSTSDQNGGDFTETTTSTDTSTEVSVGTFSESLYEAGSFSGDSFSFASVVYNASSTDSSTTQSLATASASETIDGSDSQDDILAVAGAHAADGFVLLSSNTFTSQSTATSAETEVEQSQDTQTVYEAGSFSNDSYGLSSFALSASGSDTVTSSSSNTETATASGLQTRGLTLQVYTTVENTSGGTFTQSGVSTASAQDTSSDGWSLVEQGSYGGGSFALPCYAFSAWQSSMDSSSDGGSSVETYSGSNQSQSYSGSDNSSFSDSSVDNASGSISEAGCWSNGSLSLGSVVYSGSGSDSFQSANGESGSWSGGYSGSEAFSDSSNGNSSYTENAAGSYSNGSWSLSQDVLQGGSSGASTWSDNLSAVLSNASGSKAYSLNFSNGSQETVSVYQSGTSSAGVYSNSSYNYTNTTQDTETEQTSVPSNSSSDSWQMSDSTTVAGSGSSGTLTMTAVATLGWQDSSGGGASGTSSLQTVQAYTLPGAAVSLAAPDATTVPTGGEDESDGSAPVGASPNLELVGAEEDWLFAEGQTAQQAVGPAVQLAAVQAEAGGMAPAAGNAGQAAPQAPSPPPPPASGGFWSSVWDEVSMVASYVCNNPGEALQEASRGADQGAALMLNQATFGQAYQAEAQVAAQELGPTTTAIVRGCGSVAEICVVAAAAPAAVGVSSGAVLTSAGIGVGFDAVGQAAKIYDGTQSGFNFAELGTAGQAGALLPGVGKVAPALVQAGGLVMGASSVLNGVDELGQGGHTASGLFDVTMGGFMIYASARMESSAASEEGATAAQPKSCFPAGTLVATSEGLRPIETIRVGDLVWAYDVVTRQWRLCRVRRPYSLSYKGTSVFVQAAGETIESTYRHPYWVVRGEGLAFRPWLEHLAFIPKESTTPGRWVDSCDVRVGDEVLLRDGRVVPVELVWYGPFEGTVYNMEVEELQCYTVGRNGVLVHNNNGSATGPGEPVSAPGPAESVPAPAESAPAPSGEPIHVEPSPELQAARKALNDPVQEAIHEAYQGGAGRSPAPNEAPTEEPFTYRGDARSPTEIEAAGGFKAKGTNMSVENHLYGDEPSGYVGTSKDPVASVPFGEGGYVYTVRVTNGIDVEAYWQEKYGEPLYGA